MRRLMWIAVLAACAMVFLSTGPSKAATPSWPQWGGPHRDFSVQPANIKTEWPETGPRKLWSVPLGDGYSAIVSDGRRVYTLARRGGKERVVALDAATGKLAWEHAYDAPKYEKLDMRFGEGPRSTPLIAGDRLYAVGCFGKFMCLQKDDGKLLWSRDLIKDVGGTEFTFGYAASPILYKKNVIVLCGENGGRVVAMDADTGKVAWKSNPYTLSYASPILIEVEGHPQLAILMGDQAAGLNPDNGTLLWSFPHANRFQTSMSTPIFLPDNRLFISSGGDAGSRVLQLGYDKDQATVKEAWASRKLRAAMGSLVCVGDHIYGTTGRDPSMVICLDTRTGEAVWRERGFSGGGFVAAGDKLILLDYDGVLAVADVSADGFKVHCKAQVLENPAWTSPTLVGHRLYVRDRKNLVALDLG